MIWNICRKELGHYFHSMTGYIFISIFFILCGLTFSIVNLFGRSSDIGLFYNNILLFIIFLVPVVTMKSFAEEQKMKTDQLLFTLPVSVLKIVIGKFLAALILYMAAFSIVILYLFLIYIYGSFNFIIAISNYFGTILLISVFIAIGIFISSVTENQITASVISYCVFLLLWVADYAADYIPAAAVKSMLSFLSFKRRYYEFTIGILNPASIVYYLSIIIFFILLTAGYKEKQKSN